MPKIAMLSLGLCFVLSAAPRAHAEPKRGSPPEKAPVVKAPQKADECAQATGSVRQEAYGYTHVVSVRNGCQKAVICEVWTTTDPEPRQSVSLSPGESQEVITRRGSPASEVQAMKSCRFK